MEQTEEHPLKKFLATVRNQGRITIPKEIRAVHGIKEGHIIELRFINIVGKEESDEIS